MESVVPKEDRDLCRDYFQSTRFSLEKEWCPYPLVPSAAVIVWRPFIVPVANGGMVVCIRTLTASKGQRATSATNSAEALAAR